MDGNNKTEMYGVVYKHGENDFELWVPDLPAKARDVLETIFRAYADSGCSVRGTRDDICRELS